METIDYEIVHDYHCPSCGHSPLHHRDCTNFCEDGYFDECDDDPINFYPGESLRICHECNGTGHEVWCPNCGDNLSGKLNGLDSSEDEYDY